MNARLAKRIALFATGEWLWHTDTLGLPDELLDALSHEDRCRVAAAQQELALELIRRAGFAGPAEMRSALAEGRAG